VAVTGPAEGSTFVAPASLALTATVTTNGEQINSVQFFANVTNLLGQELTAPYSFPWTNVSAGGYSVRARVNFNGNRFADSVPVNIVVSPAPPTIQSITTATGSFSLAGAGQIGQPYVLLTAPNLTSPVSWTPAITNLADGNGNLIFTNLPTTNSQQYFRISLP
jgi:hypothetical protein